MAHTCWNDCLAGASLPVHLHASLCLCLSVYLLICLSVWLSFWCQSPEDYWSALRSACQSVIVCLSVTIYIYGGCICVYRFNAVSHIQAASVHSVSRFVSTSCERNFTFSRLLPETGYTPMRIRKQQAHCVRIHKARVLGWVTDKRSWIMENTDHAAKNTEMRHEKGLSRS